MDYIKPIEDMDEKELCKIRRLGFNKDYKGGLNLKIWRNKPVICVNTKLMKRVPGQVQQ